MTPEENECCPDQPCDVCYVPCDGCQPYCPCSTGEEDDE